MLTLRPHQIPAVDAILAAKAAGIRRPLLSLPTGGGKTAIVVHLASLLKSPTLILVHRDELLTQTVQTLVESQLFPADAIGQIYGKKDQVDRPILVASVQTLARGTRLARLPKIQTLFVDEAHHAPAPTYQRILRHCGAFKTTTSAPFVLGVTATPERMDGQPLKPTFQEIVYQKSLVEYLQAGILCDLQALEIQLQANLRSVSTRMGDFQEGKLGEALLAADSPRHLVHAYERYAKDRTRTLIFTPSIEMATRVADRFTASGHAADVIHGKLPMTTRHTLRQRFHDGNLKILVNCQVYTEGVDEPAIDCVILARPTLSKGLYLQMLGRGTRHSPGKSDCLLLDCVGATQHHSVQTAAVLFDRQPDELAGRSVREALANTQPLSERAQQEARPVPPASAQLTAIPVDLTARRPAHWLRVAPGLSTLALGPAGSLFVQARGSVWDLIHSRPQIGTRTLMSGPTEALMQEHGEVTARFLPCPASLLDPRASWRQDPATPNQLRRMADLALVVTRPLTKGEAADQIAIATAHYYRPSPLPALPQTPAPAPAPRLATIRPRLHRYDFGHTADA